MDYRLSERMMLSACAAGILIVMLGNRRQSLSMSAVGAGLMVLGLQKAFQDRLPETERLPVLRREAGRYRTGETG